MSQLLPLRGDEEVPTEPDDLGETAGRSSRWRFVAAVTLVTAGVLCVAALFITPTTRGEGPNNVMPTVTGDEGFDHLTQLSSNGEKKDTSCGFPIYFSKSVTPQGYGAMNALGNQKRWLITFKGANAVQNEKKVAAAIGDKLTYQAHNLPVLMMKGSLEDLKAALKGLTPNDVKFAEQDMPMRAIPEVRDTPPMREPHVGARRLAEQSGATWGLDRVDERDLPLDKVYRNKDSHKDGQGTHVYVLDTGIRTSHTEFGGRAVPTLETFDMKAKECSPTDKTCADDKQGHGTHCAGTVAGAKYGVAKQAKVHAVKVLGDDGFGSSQTIMLAYDWLISNGKKPAVASMSLGGPGVNRGEEMTIQKVTDSGITVVVAAGNENDDACKYSPAHAKPAITVGSTTKRDDRSGFSNFGTCVDLFAPGSGITSAGHGSDTATQTFSGTSMACPHVSGAIALLLAQSPNKKPKELEAELKQLTTRDSIHDVKDSPDLLLYVGHEGAAPTPAPQPPINDCSARWKVTEGSDTCEIDQDCCLQTKVSDGEYQNKKSCKVEVGSNPGIIETESFETEEGYDFLLVPETAYHATKKHAFSGPASFLVHPKPKGIIEWTADSSVTDKGFKICMKSENTGACPSNGWRAKASAPCKPSWQYRGKTYKGTCSTVDYEEKGWCYTPSRRRSAGWVDCENCN